MESVTNLLLPHLLGVCSRLRRLADGGEVWPRAAGLVTSRIADTALGLERPPSAQDEVL